MKKVLSVIIVTYNSENVIGDCLHSIEQFNDIGKSLEVIIVDNSPAFNLQEVVQHLDLDLNVIMIHNPQNGGFGQGNNIGVCASSGDFLFFLNADTVLLEPIFKCALGEFKDTEIIAAGFCLVDTGGRVNNSFAFFPEYNYLYFFIPWSFLNILVIKFDFFSKKIFPWGADFFVRRKDFVDAEMFDERIFLCNEEPDLVKRLRNGRVRIFDKRILHLEGHTTTVEDFRFDAWMKSTEYYFEKYSLDYKSYIRREIILNELKIIVRKALRLDCQHLVAYIKQIKKRCYDC